VKLCFSNRQWAALSLLICFALVSQAFAVLRPLFPLKPEPPISGESIAISDNLVGGSAAKTTNAVGKKPVPTWATQKIYPTPEYMLVE
jgi:hypothetical protein